MRVSFSLESDNDRERDFGMLYARNEPNPPEASVAWSRWRPVSPQKWDKKILTVSAPLSVLSLQLRGSLASLDRIG